MYPKKVGVIYTSDDKFLIDFSKLSKVSDALNDSKNAWIRLENYQRRIPRFDVVSIEVKEIWEWDEYIWIKRSIEKLRDRCISNKENQETISLDDYINMPSIQ